MIGFGPAWDRCGAKSCRGSVGRIPDHGVEAVIVLACGAAQIGVEFARTKFGGGKGKAHIFLAGSFALLGPAGTDLDALRHHAIIGLSVC